MNEQTDADNRAFYKGLIGWITEEFLQRLSEMLLRGEATIASYEELLAACCSEAFDRFKLRECGYPDLESFVDEFGPAFANFIERYRHHKYLSPEANADVADYLKWEEKITLQQQATPADKQALWNATLEFFKNAIPRSAQYNRRITGLANYLRVTGSIPADMTDNDLRRELLSIIYVAIIKKTGPQTQKQRTTTPRMIDDVIGFGHLSDKLRTEFRDGYRVTNKDTGKRKVIYNEPLDAVDELLSADDDPLAAIESAEFWERLRAFAESLTADERLLLDVLRGKKTQAEVAKQLGVSQGTVSNRLKKLKLRVKAELSD